LFAAGDCATVSGGVAGAAVLGHIAGEGTVKCVRNSNGSLPAIDKAAVETVRARANASLGRADGVAWKQFENETRDVVTDYVGVRRTGKGLRMALDTLRALAKQEPRLRADDLHGVMRVQESVNVRLNAEIMATASLAREETRTGSAHWRLDFPKTDDKNWRKFVIVERGADGPVVRTQSVDQPLSAAFERSAATV
jgi:succinate dehydrogenase/fumarate reductase flavoprotein subunit